MRAREVKLGSPTGSEKERGAVMAVMTMEETILQTFVGRTYLGGPSANPFWNVPYNATNYWLAHRYFSDRSIDLLSESGREMMVEELQEVSESFHSLDELFTQRTMEYVETIGITQELIDLELNRLLAAPLDGDDAPRTR